MVNPANTMMQIMIVLILPEIKRLRTHDTYLICMDGMQVENYFNVVFLHAKGGSGGMGGVPHFIHFIIRSSVFRKKIDQK